MEGRMTVEDEDIRCQVTGTASDLSQWLRRIHGHLQREAETIMIL